MPFRQVVFWIHLVCGAGAGLAIAIMSFTGVALAFEKQIIAWAERDVARVEVPDGTTRRLFVDEMLARFAVSFPEVQPGGIVLNHDPHAAVSFTRGRGETYYVNPYSGEARAAPESGTRAFMRTMTTWHRYLGMSGETRGVGKAINGACNFVFLGLAVTGVYIWFPRRWSWSAFRPVVWFNGKWRGKPRDWNWHNVIGFWSAPVLIVLTATALPISYQWAGNFINTITRTDAAAGGRGRGGVPTVKVAAPFPDAVPLALDTLFAAVQERAPRWTQISLRLGEAGGRNGPSERRAGESRAKPASEDSGMSTFSFTVREAGSWPRTATRTVGLDPYTGDVISESGFADQPLGRQVRSWTRFLHTGEALGYVGQFVAGLASLGGVVLCYTGFALAWRRFFGGSGSS